ncbi:unnamed protein product [Protopolystoma xenopodis]|uniref:Uncharacterized protein n=1 Tax=Protopolystoma xenopodis TaxID=117903 RepID=A0A3S5BXN8_9PLAT|nr:unnamed protein product [Protopolystoma xenopodis]
MAELRENLGGAGQSSSLANLEVWVNVTVYNWFELNSRSGWAYTKIYSSNAIIKFLGGLVRPFKSKMTFRAYMVIYMPDGTQIKFTGNRRVDLYFYCNDNDFINKVSMVVPSDSVITYPFQPDGDKCPLYKLQVMHQLRGALFDGHIWYSPLVHLRLRYSPRIIEELA